MNTIFLHLQGLVQVDVTSFFGLAVFLILLMDCKFQELGLEPGIPVGTSLIDAHAGGVGVIESVPPSEAEGCHPILYFCDLSFG